MKKIIIINGPNLNLLGKREPGIYGAQSFEDFYAELKTKYEAFELSYFQSNVEGELINKIQEEANKELDVKTRHDMLRAQDKEIFQRDEEIKRLQKIVDSRGSPPGNASKSNVKKEKKLIDKMKEVVEKVGFCK